MKTIYIISILLISSSLLANEWGQIQFPGRIGPAEGRQQRGCDVLQNTINYANHAIRKAGFIFEIKQDRCTVVDTGILNYTVRYTTQFQTIEDVDHNIMKFNQLQSMRNFCAAYPEIEYYANVYIYGGSSQHRDVMITSGFEPVPEHSNSNFRISMCKPFEKLLEPSIFDDQRTVFADDNTYSIDP